MPAPKRKLEGLIIPWPLIGALAAILSGVIWVNVQIAILKNQVDFLYRLEMDRYPRQGPKQ